MLAAHIGRRKSKLRARLRAIFRDGVGTLYGINSGTVSGTLQGDTS